MVGPLGDTVEFPVSPPVVLVPERDGVRILGDEAHELLRRVPAPLADVFRVGSTTPGERPVRQSQTWLLCTPQQYTLHMLC
jgi:Vps16, N-terminal region